MTRPLESTTVVMSGADVTAGLYLRTHPIVVMGVNLLQQERRGYATASRSRRGTETTSIALRGRILGFDLCSCQRHFHSVHTVVCHAWVPSTWRASSGINTALDTSTKTHDYVATTLEPCCCRNAMLQPHNAKRRKACIQT
jgi:hypothetical protein